MAEKIDITLLEKYMLLIYGHEFDTYLDYFHNGLFTDEEMEKLETIKKAVKSGELSKKYKWDSPVI